MKQHWGTNHRYISISLTTFIGHFHPPLFPFPYSSFLPKITISLEVISTIRYHMTLFFLLLIHSSQNSHLYCFSFISQPTIIWTFLTWCSYNSERQIRRGNWGLEKLNNLLQVTPIERIKKLMPHSKAELLMSKTTNDLCNARSNGNWKFYLPAHN